MARYIDVCMRIAESIAAGDPPAKDPLPSIRATAERYRTTPATAARAYRQLADAGVIDTADRRRARVSPQGATRARRLIATGLATPALRLAGSDDLGLDLALRTAGPSVITVGPRGSFHGLSQLWKGAADAAAIHLPHHSGDYNAPFAASLLRGRRPAIIHLWRREQGLLTTGDCPAALHDAKALARLRFARRQPGTGTRVLLDRLLAQAGIPEQAVAGPDAASHLEVAMAIASGQADTGLAVRAAATVLGLAFTPVAWEDFDIVLSADALDAAESLIAALRDAKVQAPVSALGGYDLSRSGEVRLLA